MMANIGMCVDLAGLDLERLAGPPGVVVDHAGHEIGADAFAELCAGGDARIRGKEQPAGFARLVSATAPFRPTEQPTAWLAGCPTLLPAGDCESGGLSGNAARPGSARLCCAYARRWDRTGAAARMLLVHRDRQVGVDGDACSSEDAAVVSGSASRVSGCSRTRRCIAQACGVCASSSCVGVRGCVACVAKGPSGCGGPSLAGIRVLAVTASGRRTVPGRVCPCRRFRSGRGSRSADRGPGTRVRGMSVPRSGGVCSCRPRSGVRSGADRGPGARVRGTSAPRSGVAGTGRRWRRPGVPVSGRGSRSGSLRPSASLVARITTAALRPAMAMIATASSARRWL